MRIVIIGAGPTGLGAAWRLEQRRHRDYVVLEQEPFVGGHAASFTTKDGFVFDMGGHVTFSKDRRFLDVVDDVLAGRFLTHVRKAFVYAHERFIPYPFQNNVASLPPEAAWECLQGLLERAPDAPPPRTFAEHIERSFGRGIARQFMMPYNRKVWAHEPSAMSVTWMADRVSQVSLADVLRPFVFGPESTWGPNATFRYPEHGTGSIYRALAARLPEGKLRTRERVVAIDAGARRLRLATGEELRYDALVSSMPLDLLARAIVAPPARVTAAARQLVHNQGFFVGVGVKGKSPVGHHWTYFPEERFPFYRVTVLSHYSPRLVPRRGVYSLLSETSLAAGKAVSEPALRRRVVAALLRTPLMKGKSERDVLATWSRRAPYSYPIPTLGREEAQRTLTEFLERRAIYSRGRFGSWAYERGNMDHSFLAGVDAASAIAG